MRLVHFQRVSNGVCRLLFEIRFASVPELRQRVGRVQQRWRIAHTQRPAYTHGDGAAVAEGHVRVVTKGARHRVIFRQPGVVKKPAAEGDRLRSRRIVRRKENGRESKGRFDLNHSPDRPGASSFCDRRSGRRRRGPLTSCAQRQRTGQQSVLEPRHSHPYLHYRCGRNAA